MIRVAMIQQCPPPGRQDSLADVERQIRAAAHGGAHIAVFPELYSPGFYAIIDRGNGETTLPAAFRERAESIPGNLTRSVGEMAKSVGIHVILGMLEHDRAANIYRNAAVLFAPNGEPIHTHRKTMLTPRIDEGIAPGNNYDVIDTAIGRIGILICADATCPEPARILALKGAEMIFLCSGDFHSSWMVGGKDLVEQIWQCSSASPSRAVDNALFWIAVNGAGVQNGTEFFGGSRVIAPDGEIIAQAPCGPDARTIVFADLDLNLRARVESTFPLMSRRRPELYGLLVSSEFSHKPS